jgi:NAD-dependent SIR2 family protein deacetylase
VFTGSFKTIKTNPYRYLRLGAAMRVMRKEFKEQKKQMSSLKKFYENALQDEKSKNIKLLKQIENQKDQFHVYRQQIDFDKEQLEIQLHEQQKKQLTKPKLQLIIDQLEQDKKRLVELLCTTKEFQTSFQV